MSEKNSHRPSTSSTATSCNNSIENQMEEESLEDTGQKMKHRTSVSKKEKTVPLYKLSLITTEKPREMIYDGEKCLYFPASSILNDVGVENVQGTETMETTIEF